MNANTFWKIIANQNHLLSFNSLAIVEIAAKHGESYKLKIKNDNAAIAVGNH